MSSKQKNRILLRTANKRWSAETIWASIGRGTSTLPSGMSTRIEYVSWGILPVAEIDGSQREVHHSDEDDDEPEPTNSCDHDNHPGNSVQSEVTMANMREIVEQ